MTLKDLREAINDLPDDDEVFLSYVDEARGINVYSTLEFTFHQSGAIFLSDEEWVLSDQEKEEKD